MSNTFSAADDEQLVELVAGHRILWDYSENDFKNTLKKELIWKKIARLLNKTGEQCKKRWRNIRDHYKKMKSQDSNMSTGSAAPKKRATYWQLLHFLDTVQHERSSFSNATESDIETAYVEKNTHVPESEQVHDPLPSESNEGATSGAVSGNSSTSKSKVKRAFSKVGEPSFQLEGIQPKTKKVSNKQEIVTLLKKSVDDRQILNKYLEQSIETEKEDEIDAFVKSIGLTIKKFDEEMQADVKSKIFNIVSQYELNHIRKNKTSSYMHSASPSTSYSQSHNSLSSDVLLTVTQGGNEDEELTTYTDLTNLY